jgi:hypothetical protein
MKRRLGKSKHRWENFILDSKETVCKGMDCIKQTKILKIFFQWRTLAEIFFAVA